MYDEFIEVLNRNISIDSIQRLFLLFLLVSHCDMSYPNILLTWNNKINKFDLISIDQESSFGDINKAFYIAEFDAWMFLIEKTKTEPLAKHLREKFLSVKEDDLKELVNGKLTSKQTADLLNRFNELKKFMKENESATLYDVKDRMERMLSQQH